MKNNLLVGIPEKEVMQDVGYPALIDSLRDEVEDII